MPTDVAAHDRIHAYAPGVPRPRSRCHCLRLSDGHSNRCVSSISAIAWARVRKRGWLETDPNIAG